MRLLHTTKMQSGLVAQSVIQSISMLFKPSYGMMLPDCRFRAASLYLALSAFCFRCSAQERPHPVLRFAFCDLSSLKICEPTIFGSNSPFRFADISSSTFYYNRFPSAPSLRVSCGASEPLRWRIYGMSTRSPVSKLLRSTAKQVSKNGTLMRYTYEFHWESAVSGRIRCESHENTSRAAEVYISTRDPKPSYTYRRQGFSSYIPFQDEGVTHSVVPCSFGSFDANFNATKIKLMKAPLSGMTKPSAECIQCFPRVTFDSSLTSCESNCGPFGLSREFWKAVVYNNATSIINSLAIYMCPPTVVGDAAVYLAPLDPSKRGHARLYHSTNETDGPMPAIACSQRNGHSRWLRLTMSRCSNLMDCELKTRHHEGEINLLDDGDDLHGTKPHFDIMVRTVIAKPFSHGIVKCDSRSHLLRAFTLEMAYYFTGLNHISYFTSQKYPLDAIIVLRPENVSVNPDKYLSFTCTISTFVLFSTLQLIREFLNGSNLTDDGFNVTQSVEEEYKTTHKFSVILTEDVRSITCRAPLRNAAQFVAASFFTDETLRQANSPTSDTGLVTTFLVVLLSVAFASLLCVLYASRKARRLKQQRQLLQLEKQEFLYGNPEHFSSNPNGNHVVPNLREIGFPESYVISPDKLKIDMGNVLGEGQFGQCVVGEYEGKAVAVKIAKKSLGMDNFKDFLQEVKLMSFIGKHENIIDFIGAVVDDISKGSCKAVLELSPFGNLLNYLRRHRSKSQGYSEVTGSEEHSENHLNLEAYRLCHFSWQIAAGMEYLAGKKIIHADLAARNVLLFPAFTVKLADFGLSRRLHKHARNYVKKNNAPLPWRWMAIESLKFMEFSTMSDVWSFGVTTWEIFTIGQVPFAEYTFSSEFKQLLERGLRLEKPEVATDSIYQFMMSTWNQSAGDRPTFTAAKAFFKQAQDEHNLPVP